MKRTVDFKSDFFRKKKKTKRRLPNLLSIICRVQALFVLLMWKTLSFFSGSMYLSRDFIERFSGTWGKGGGGGSGSRRRNKTNEMVAAVDLG